jgi:hypothetical protein
MPNVCWGATITGDHGSKRLHKRNIAVNVPAALVLGCILNSLRLKVLKNPKDHISDIRRIHSELNSHLDLFHLQETDTMLNGCGFYPVDY